MSARVKALWAVLIASLSGLGIIAWTLFEWSVIDRVPANVYMEFAGIAWMLFFLMMTLSFVALYDIRETRWLALAPLAIQVLAVLIVFHAPLRALWVRGDFLLFQDDRDAVVRKVLEGELQPNVPGRPGVIALAPSWPRLSMGGNEIVVDGEDSRRFVFFYTFRGARGNFAGFLYVPEGLRPGDSGIAPRQLQDVTVMAEHWVHVSPARREG